MNQNRQISICDNSSLQLENSKEIADIDKIANISLRTLQLKNEGSLLIIPGDLDECEDDIADGTICTLDRRNVLGTGNIMGFIGIGSTRLKISSRFDHETQSDFFLHYMLEKVYHINLFDFNFTFNSQNIFDILLYLFPYYLDKALQQGVYRQYMTYEHNDDRVKGPVDIPRHIRKNVPFTGNIAYKTREYSTDNNLTQLIRHTIEYICSRSQISSILDRTEQDKENVSLIRQSTPSYSKSERNSIISKNNRFAIHPYYCEYAPLQKLCLQILRHAEIRYGDSNDEVYGLLFDGAWLWEEYLNTLLRQLNFKHPKNKRRSEGFSMFEHSHGAIRYPDFYLKDKMVLDAKYKRLQDIEISSFGREDLNQIVTYMHVLSMDKGGFIFPGTKVLESKTPGSLKGIGGMVYPICLPIPQNCVSYTTFCQNIESSEQKVLSRINSILQ